MLTRPAATRVYHDMPEAFPGLFHSGSLPRRRGAGGALYPGRVSDTPEHENRSGDLLVRIGGVIFAVGAVATLITFIPMFIGSEPFPPLAYGVSMLMGAGFAVAGLGMARSIAVQRREAVRAAARTAPATPGG